MTRGCEGVRCDSWPGPRWDWSFSISGLFRLSLLHFFIDQRSISKLKIWDKKKRAVTTTFWKLLDFSSLMNSFLPINTSKHKTNMLGLEFGRFGVGAISLWLHFKDLKDLKKRIYFTKTIHKGGGGALLGGREGDSGIITIYNSSTLWGSIFCVDCFQEFSVSLNIVNKILTSHRLSPTSLHCFIFLKFSFPSCPSVCWLDRLITFLSLDLGA